MSIMNLFEVEKTKELSKISSRQASDRALQVFDSLDIVPAEHHAQLGRMAYGTNQKVSYAMRGGKYIYFVRSSFKK